MKNGTIDLHTLINDLIQKLLAELTESQASINASVDSFVSCGDHLKLNQALVQNQSTALANRHFAAPLGDRLNDHRQRKLGIDGRRGEHGGHPTERPHR